MLPRNRRLRAAQVRRVMAGGVPLRGRFMSAKVLHGMGDTIQCAAVVPVSLSGNAVERNRLRRIIYRAIDIAPAPEGVHVVVFLRKLPPDEKVDLPSDIHAMFATMVRGR